MDKTEFVRQMLPLVMSQDIRLQVHSLSLVDSNLFAHTEDCARCSALKLLGYKEEYEYYSKLSTVTDLHNI